VSLVAERGDATVATLDEGLVQTYPEWTLLVPATA
jgi:hypothetical protein